ncbi:EscJ/YscJ/HrcJ family type III secretion inner membrane ring protein [Enterobacterales bacterium CwR94]|nr:EscJ/YscJ/HrcJ family type III secretion inner membrane ring protein [Enterobacterales bacterium CwR94]
MMHPTLKTLIVLLLSLLLVGCKSTLFSNLSENEANEILALLKWQNIEADKQQEKDGKVSVRVDAEQFVNAVELLRQNGLPRPSSVKFENLFPVDQLISSPVQERAKIIFLKEQQLESMLRLMNGVVDAQVLITESPETSRSTPDLGTVSAIIKYSPEINLDEHRPAVQNMLLNAIPGLTADHISLLLQTADYRFQPTNIPISTAKTTLQDRLFAWRNWIAGAMVSLLFLIMMMSVLWRRKSR